MALIKTNIEYPGINLNMIVEQAFSNSLFYKNYKGIRTKTSIKSKYFYYDLVVNAPLTAPNPDGCTHVWNDATLNQRNGTICEFETALAFTYSSLTSTAEEVNTQMSFPNEKISQATKLWNAILASLVKSVGNQWDNIVINGDSDAGVGILDLCDGLLKKFLADPDVIDVSGTTLTPANIIAELQKGIAALPDHLAFNSDFPVQFLMNAKTARIYKSVLANSLQTNRDITQAQPLFIEDYEIIVDKFMPDNEYFISYGENFFFVKDGESDMTTLKISDLGLTTSCDRIEVVLKFRAAVDYERGGDIVYYHA